MLGGRISVNVCLSMKSKRRLLGGNNAVKAQRSWWRDFLKCARSRCIAPSRVKRDNLPEGLSYAEPNDGGCDMRRSVQLGGVQKELDACMQAGSRQ